MGLCKCWVHSHASQHQESAEALASAQAFGQAYGTLYKKLLQHEANLLRKGSL